MPAEPGRDTWAAEAMLNSAMPVQTQGSHSSAGPESSARTAVLQNAARYAVQYLDNIHAQPVAPPLEAVAALRELREPVPDDPACPEMVLNLLTRFGSPATVANSGGRFFGF